MALREHGSTRRTVKYNIGRLHVHVPISDFKSMGGPLANGEGTDDMPPFSLFHQCRL